MQALEARTADGKVLRAAHSLIPLSRNHEEMRRGRLLVVDFGSGRGEIGIAIKILGMVPVLLEYNAGDEGAMEVLSLSLSLCALSLSLSLSLCLSVSLSLCLSLSLSLSVSLSLSLSLS